MWRSLLGAAPAGAAQWTLEEHARFAALRDIETFRLLLKDRRLFAAARRAGFFVGSAIPERQVQGVKSSTAAAGDAAGSSAARPPGAPRDGTAGSEGAPAADHPPRAGAQGVPAGGQRHHSGVNTAVPRPRRRSAAKVIEREAVWQAKQEVRRRRAFFGALSFVGAYIRRAEATDGNGSAPMPSGAANGEQLGDAGRPAANAAGAASGGAGGGVEQPPAPLSGGKRSCERRGSTSAAAGSEASGKRCEGSGGSARPAAAVAVGGAPDSEPYSQRWLDEWGAERMQWYGCCGECGHAHVPVWDVGRDPARRSWACEECCAVRRCWS